MKWQFNFTVGSKNYAAEADIIDSTLQIEIIQVKCKDFSITLQNNRPLLQFIELKRPLTWKQIEGEMKDQGIVNAVIQKLEQHLVQTKK